MATKDTFQGCPLPKRSQLHAPAASVGTSCPLPSRTSLNPSPSRSVRRGPSTRVMIGAGLFGVALAAPLVGFAVGSPQEVTEEKRLGSFAGEGETFEVPLEASLPDGSELDAVTAAASRAKVRTPVEVSQCVPVGQSADGSRGISQRSTAVWPLTEGSYVQTSSFSWRVSPISGELMLHAGVDWTASAGTAILAAYPGVVTEVGYNGRSGNFVEITHQTEDGTPFTTLYMHQLSGGITVSTGEEVEAGQTIGAVGSTGWSTGPHLHFEVRNGGGSAVEPIGWMRNLEAEHAGEGCL